MLSTMEKVIQLKKVPLFENLSGEELLAISNIAKEKSVSPEKTIFVEGSTATGLHILISGKVEIHRNTSGQKLLLTKLGPSECFGEISLFDDAPHSATVTASEPTTYLLINKEAFLDLVHEQPTIAIGIIKVFCLRLRETSAKL